MTMDERSTKPYSVGSDVSVDCDVDEVVMQLIKELDGADDPSAVVARFCQSHPSRADEFRARAGTRQILVMSEPRSAAVPQYSGRLGDFQIVGLLAVGGMGAIYEAVQEPFVRRVVVKTIRDDRRDLSARKRFFREQTVLARLHHTHIVPIHAGGKDGDLEYFAMPYIEGATLDHVVRWVWHHAATRPAEATPSLAELVGRSAGHPSGPAANSPSAETTPIATTDGGSALDRAKFCLSAKYLRSVAKVIADAGDALHHAHNAGVYHRDVKPSNIMVDAQGHCWIVDFGLAAYQAERSNMTGSNGHEGLMHGAASGVMGTRRYMAPEQFHGRADARTDVWGLGVTLYQLLSLRPAFESRAEIESGELERPRVFVHNVPLDLEAICMKALRKDPEHRYPTADEFAGDLRRWLRGMPSIASKPSPWRHVWLWSRRNPGWSIAAVLTLAVLLGAAGGGIAIGKYRADAAEARSKAISVQTEADRREYAAREKHRAETIDRAWKAALGGDLDGAEETIAQAAQAGASLGQVHMLRGQIALHRGQCSKARRHLEEAVQLLPESVSAWGMLAAAHAYDGHWERYGRMIREMEKLTPSTPEDFLFKGHAEANMEPERGLRTIKQAFERRPMMGIALLVRADVRTLVAQDTDVLEEAEGAVQDAKYAKELLRNNPAALWVSLQAHLAKAGVHEHRGDPDQRRAELELAGKDADALKHFTAFPEAVVYRWMYFREVGREEEVLEELRLASAGTDHLYVAFCYALTLYRRGGPGDLEEALRVLEKKRGTYDDRLLPFVLAEHDYANKHDWPARAQKVAMDFAERVQDEAAVMDTQAVLCLLGKKEEAVKTSKALQKQPMWFDTLRIETLLACLRYNAGDLPADEFIGDANGSRWNQCLAHYYVAMTKLAEGDRKGAQEHFDEVIKTRAFQWGPYDMSWVFQARLAKDPTWPRWISKERAK
jgi:serine/threonine protein kinase